MAAMTPLHIDDDMSDAIATAFETGNVVTVAYNGDDGWPQSRAAARRRCLVPSSWRSGCESATTGWPSPSRRARRSRSSTWTCWSGAWCTPSTAAVDC